MSSSNPPDAEAPVRDAVLEELRSALRDLSEALLEGVGREMLVNALVHAWVLADLAELDQGRTRSLLRGLRDDLRVQGVADPQFYAQQLALAADRL